MTLFTNTSPELSKKIEQATNKEWFDEGNNEFQELKKNHNTSKCIKLILFPQKLEKSVTVNIPKECKLFTFLIAIIHKLMLFLSKSVPIKFKTYF